MIKNTDKRNLQRGPRKFVRGFSLIELLISLTITLVIVSLSFTLLARSLARKQRDDQQASALADTNQAIDRMMQEIMNSGFALNSNGLVTADCTATKIRVRANLNAFKGETTSNTVNDINEDIIFQLVNNPGVGSSLVRTDVSTGQSSIVASDLDNRDIDGDGIGDGLIFIYLDASGTPVAPASAVRINTVVRVDLPAAGQPGSPGYQPEITKALTSSIVLRNTRLLEY